LRKTEAVAHYTGTEVEQAGAAPGKKSRAFSDAKAAAETPVWRHKKNAPQRQNIPWARLI